MNPVDQSYDYCTRLTKRTARNFYYSFLTLPPVKRRAMCVVYAWMRWVDDLADEAPSVEQARTALADFQQKTHAAFDGGLPPTTYNLQPDLWLSFAEVVKQYQIPVRYFDEIVAGALMDQTVMRYATFEELYQYCYRVASVVGLVCLKVFGYQDPKTEQYGEWLGIAFQLTNILRDVKEDAQRGRIYLPLEDLKRYGVTEDDVLNLKWSEPLHELLIELADRAELYYEKAKFVVPLAEADSRATLQIMTEIYHGIWEEMQKMEFRVLDRRARVPTWRKLWIVAKHCRFSR